LASPTARQPPPERRLAAATEPAWQRHRQPTGGVPPELAPAWRFGLFRGRGGRGLPVPLDHRQDLPRGDAVTFFDEDLRDTATRRRPALRPTFLRFDLKKALAGADLIANLDLDLDDIASCVFSRGPAASLRWAWVDLCSELRSTARGV